MSEPVWVPLGAQPAGADELAYVQITSPVTCPGLLESSSTTVMTAPAITVDGITPIVVEVFVPGVYFTDAPDSEAYLFDGSTSLGRVFAHPSGKVLVNKTNAFIHVARRLTPSAGAHTYSLRAQVSSGAGVQMLAGPGGVGQWNPAFIRVTRAMPFVPGTAAAAAIPSGVVTQYAGATAPTDWLLCDGSAVSRTTYAALFAAIGTAYGAGDGSTTFALPDLRGRVAVGKGTNVAVDALNDNDGVAVASRRPQHRHTPHYHAVQDPDTNPVHRGGSTSAGWSVRSETQALLTHPLRTNVLDGGSGVGGDSLDAPAYLVVNYIIKT